MFGIALIGNLHSHTKTMQMQAQWRQKQASGDYAAKPGASAGEEAAPGSEEKLKELRRKLELGGRLTKKELEFLKEKAPELYEEYMQGEEERKLEERAYKEALKRCKTQEEVERLRGGALGRSLARVQSIKNNPNIPPEKKAIRIALEKRKTEDVERNTRRFVERGEYARLPTEAEVSEAAKAAAEKQRGELGLDWKGAERGAGKPSAAAPTEAKRSEIERKPSGVEVESEAERKVRRARARVAYALSQGGGESDADAGWSGRA